MNTVEMYDPLLTTEQAAKWLSISAASLERYRATGEVKIPHVVIGKRLCRYKLSDLARFAEENTVAV